MAGTTIAALPASGALVGTELMYADNGSADVKVTSAQIAAYALGSGAVLSADTTGVTDVSAALSSALNNALTPLVVIPPGDYRIESTVTWTVPKKVVCAPGARFIKGADVVLIKPYDGFDWVQAISAFGTTDVRMQDNQNPADDGSEGTATTHAATITLTGAQTLAKGDRVKVISDDLPDYSVAGGVTNKPRKGEDAIVGVASSGVTVTLTNLLIDTYSTNPRLVKYKNTGVFEWWGGTFDYDSAVVGSSSWNVEYFAPHACRFRIYNVESANARWPVIAPYGCFSSTVDNCYFYNSYTNGAGNQFGYGVLAVVCTDLTVTRLKAQNLRHGFTTNPEWIAAGSTNYENYGRCRNITVAHCQFHGMQNAGVDTHEDADGVLFDSCQIYGTSIGGRSTGNGIGMRGRRIKAVNCIVVNCQSGIWVAVYEDAQIIGCEFYNTVMDVITIGQSGAAASLYPQKRIVFSSCYFESYGYITTSGVIQCNGNDATNNIDVEMNNCRIKLIGNIAISPRLIGIWFTNLKFRNLQVNLEDYSGPSGINIFWVTGASGSSISGDGLEIRNGGYSAIANLANGGSAGSTNTGTIDNITMTGSVDVTGAVNGNIFNINTSPLPLLRVSGKKKIGSAVWKSTSYISQTASNSFIPRFAMVNDKVINVELSGSNGAVSAGNFPDNVDAGTVVNIWNGSNGTVTFSEPSLALGTSSAASFYRTESATSANKWRQI